jgi:preprotein translocase subunit YajC
MPVIVAWDTPTRLAAVRFTDAYIRSASQRGDAEPTGKVTMNIFAANSQSSGGGYFIYLLMALFFVALYFLMIRPQQKRRRETEQMQRAMGPGDEIVTVGGLYGTVVEINDDVVTLEIAPGVEARYARAAIGKVVTPAARHDDDDEEEDEEEDASTDTVAKED